MLEQLLPSSLIPADSASLHIHSILRFTCYKFLYRQIVIFSSRLVARGKVQSLLHTYINICAYEVWESNQTYVRLSYLLSWVYVFMLDEDARVYIS